MADAVVRRYVHGTHVLVAQLNRPHVKNAFNDAVYEELIAAFEQLADDVALHALVITGTGDFFSSGADLKHAMAQAAAGNVVAPSKGWPKRAMDAFLRCKKLVVAAVNGPAVGIGVTLLPHCDLVFCAPHATFWTPFMRVGIVPEFASSYTFPQQVGRLMANDLLIRSKKINAQEALGCGLVNEVVSDKAFLEVVLAKVHALVENPYTARNLPVYKYLLNRHHAPVIREAMVHEFEELDRLFLSGEAQEATIANMTQWSSKL